MFKSRYFRFLTVVAIAAIALAGVFTAFGQLFVLEDYPGGYTKTIYELKSEESPYPGTVTIEITPAGEDDFKVKMGFEGVEKREDLTLSLFGFFSPGMYYRSHQDTLDFTPLMRIDKKSVEPNKPYILPPGKLETGEREKIADIDVIMATFTDPAFPNQRIIIAIPDVETRKLLPFLPLFKLEEKKDDQWTITTSVELKKFEHHE